VPSLLISPLVEKGVNSTVYEHASIPATIKGLWNLKADYLNPRDEAANQFISADDILTTPRKDCPEKLPDIFPNFEDVPRK